MWKQGMAIALASCLVAGSGYAQTTTSDDSLETDYTQESTSGDATGGAEQVTL